MGDDQAATRGKQTILGKIGVLLVDADHKSVTVTSKNLERKDQQIKSFSAATTDEAWTVLNTEDIDVVVSDYHLPRTNGIEFLKSFRATYPGKPFILFTAEGSEAVASDAISAGVTDYILKDTGTDQFEELANRIRNAVSRDPIEMTCRTSKEKYRELFQNSPIGIWEEDFSQVKDWVDRLNEQGIDDVREYLEAHPDIVEQLRKDVVTLSVNDKVLDMYQVESIDDFEENFSQIFGDGSDAAFLDVIEAIAEGETEIQTEKVDHRLDGEAVALSFRWSVLPGYEDTYSRVIVSTVDVTEQKQAENALRQNEQFLQSVFDGIRSGITILDEAMNIVRVNEWIQEQYSEERPLLGKKCYAVYRNRESPCPSCPTEETLTRSEVQTETVRFPDGDGSFWWGEVSTYPFENDAGEVIGAIEYVQDVTDRERHKQQVSKREEYFRELYARTQDCLAATDEQEIFEHVVDSAIESFGFSRVSFLRFDEKGGDLRTGAVSNRFAEDVGNSIRIEPGDNPLWKPFQQGQTAIVEASDVETFVPDVQNTNSIFVAVPIGDYGVLLINTPDQATPEDIDIQMLELCAANAEAILDRIGRENELGEVSSELSDQKDQVADLQGIMDVVQKILTELPERNTRAAMETLVCEELASTDVIDFAWVGTPQSTDVELDATTWAGEYVKYLDAIDTKSADELVPAQQAAERREQVTIANVSQHVQTTSWAKNALSMGFKSLISIPLVYDDVLYGVLTSYSNREEAFKSGDSTLLSGVASQLTAYYCIENIRSTATSTDVVELEFTIADSSFPLYSLSRKTDSTLHFETIVDTTDTTVDILLTIESGDPEEVQTRATEVTAISSAEWFGNPDNRHLVIEKKRPVFVTEVEKHGGTVKRVVADGDNASVVLSVPTDIPFRPLIEWLQSTYRDIDLVARRETSKTPSRDLPEPDEILTERQFQILKAAYFGGYYENPRGITGEGLAEQFDITHSTVYNHLRAAHASLMTQIFNSKNEN